MAVALQPPSLKEAAAAMGSRFVPAMRGFVNKVLSTSYNSKCIRRASF